MIYTYRALFRLKRKRTEYKEHKALSGMIYEEKAVPEVLGDASLNFGEWKMWWMFGGTFCRSVFPGDKGLTFVTAHFTTFCTARQAICQLELTLGASSPKIWGAMELQSEHGCMGAGELGELFSSQGGLQWDTQSTWVRLVTFVTCSIIMAIWIHNFNVLPALLQKLVGDFFDFSQGNLENLVGNLEGIFRGFFLTHRTKLQKFRGKFRSIFRNKIRSSKKIFRAKFTLQTCHLNSMS